MMWNLDDVETQDVAAALLADQETVLAAFQASTEEMKGVDIATEATEASATDAIVAVTNDIDLVGAILSFTVDPDGPMALGYTAETFGFGGKRMSCQEGRALVLAGRANRTFHDASCALLSRRATHVALPPAAFKPCRIHPRVDASLEWCVDRGMSMSAPRPATGAIKE